MKLTPLQTAHSHVDVLSVAMSYRERARNRHPAGWRRISILRPLAMVVSGMVPGVKQTPAPLPE